METRFLDRGDGTRLAYRFRPGAGPILLFLPGYMSDMSGTKAEAVDAWAARRGRAFLRLDYSGCGASEGAFADGTIGRWTADAHTVADAVAPGPLVLVGSSMGGWIALLLARALGSRVAGLVLIAPAPDFTEWGVEATLTDREHAAMRDHGWIERPSAYGGSYTYTRALVEDGRTHKLMSGPIAVDAPVRILHGQRDADVPWGLSIALAERLRSEQVQLTLVKDGDHRLSRDSDLALLTATLDRLPEP